MANILVCDDDKEIVDAIEIYLMQEGYTIFKAYDGQEAIRVLKEQQIHLLLIDIMMPKLDGIHATLKIREYSSIPIIFLSAKSEDNDKILGLNIGADDYITKPFNPMELVARVKSNLRRYTTLGNLNTENNALFQVGGLCINDDTKEVTVDGESVKLTPIEYNILLLLVKNCGRVFSIDQIYESIWNEEAIGADNTVAVHIRHIREKIEINPKEPRYLKVVWGVEASESIAEAVKSAEAVEASESIAKAVEAADNRDQEEIADVIKLDGRKGKKEEKRKRDKVEKPKMSRRGLRTFLRILQHAALAAMIFSMIVTVACGTVRFEGLRSDGSFTDLIFSMNAGEYFEDSAFFNRILGYATADIIRYGVVCSQMETNGDFDGEKLVDVTAYNHRNEGLSGEYVTAVYKLEDLLKWQKYGFEYTAQEMTEEQADAFLAKIPQVTVQEMDADTEVRSNVQYRIVDSDSGFVTDYQPASALADHAESSARQEVEIEIINPYAEEAEEVSEYTILVNRYKTAEGKNLEDYVSDWEQYYALCDSVQTAAKSLAYNYEEYLTGAEYFRLENSNVRYLIEKTEDHNTRYYSNMKADSSDRDYCMKMMEKLSREEAGAVQAAVPYLYYSPADMVYRTNTTIAESTVEEVLHQYAYAYPEDVRIWISVDTSYPAVDAFRQGAEYMPNLWQWAMTALCSGLLYLALFVWQTIMTGREYDEDGVKRIRLEGFDMIPTEGALLVAAGVCGGADWSLCSGCGRYLLLLQFGQEDQGAHAVWQFLSAAPALPVERFCVEGL